MVDTEKGSPSVMLFWSSWLWKKVSGVRDCDLKTAGWNSTPWCGIEGFAAGSGMRAQEATGVSLNHNEAQPGRPDTLGSALYFGSYKGSLY